MSSARQNLLNKLKAAREFGTGSRGSPSCFAQGTATVTKTITTMPSQPSSTLSSPAGKKAFRLAQRRKIAVASPTESTAHLLPQVPEVTRRSTASRFTAQKIFPQDTVREGPPCSETSGLRVCDSFQVANAAGEERRAQEEARRQKETAQAAVTERVRAELARYGLDPVDVPATYYMRLVDEAIADQVEKEHEEVAARTDKHSATIFARNKRNADEEAHRAQYESRYYERRFHERPAVVGPFLDAAIADAEAKAAAIVAEREAASKPAPVLQPRKPAFQLRFQPLLEQFAEREAAAAAEEYKQKKAEQTFQRMSTFGPTHRPFGILPEEVIERCGEHELAAQMRAKRPSVPRAFWRADEVLRKRRALQRELSSKPIEDLYRSEPPAPVVEVPESPVAPPVAGDVDDVNNLSEVYSEWDQRFAQAETRRQERQQQQNEAEPEIEHSTSILETIKSWASNAWASTKNWARAWFCG